MLVQELVELVLTDLQRKPGNGLGRHTSLEVGCGSGAISLSLLKNLPQVGFVSNVGYQTCCDLFVFVLDVNTAL